MKKIYQVRHTYKGLDGEIHGRILSKGIPTKKLADQLANDFENAIDCHSDDVFWGEETNKFNQQ